VLQNDGHGNFALQTPLVLNRRDVAVASVADVNNDGIPDIVMVLTPGDGLSGGRQYDYVNQLSVWTWLADGHGGFKPGTQAPIALATTDQSAPSSVTLTDLDGDGFPDVLLGSAQSGSVRVAINDGTGNMRQPSHNLPYIGQQQLPFAPDEPGVAQQVFADLNNDGQSDFVTMSSAALEVYLGQRTGGFTHWTSLAAPGSGVPWSWMKVGDLNNDGIPDIVTGFDTQSGSEMAVFLGNGDGTFRQAPTFTVQPPGYGISDATLGDVNNDGKLDAVVALTGADSSAADAVAYAVCFGDGKGGLSFNANTIVPIQTSFSASFNSNLHIAPTVGDFNGDGKLDLMVPTKDSSGLGLTLYLGRGNGTFTAGSAVYAGAAQSDVQELAADVNGDGNLDLVACSAAAGPRCSVYLGDGHGGFQVSVVLDFSGRGTDAGFPIYPSDLALGDFNGDGKLDLAVSYYSAYGAMFATAPKTIDLYLSDGTGKFATPQTVDVGDNPLTVVSIPRAPFLDAGAFAVTDHAPIANNDQAGVVSGQSVRVALLANDSDPDEDPLTITALGAPAHGTAHLDSNGTPNDPTDDSVIYAPAAGFTGTDSFTYTIADPAGVEASATITVVVRSASAQTPTITWANPADVTYGTALDATQLDASASVPGTFTYSPAVGTVLHAGGGQMLSVTFTPNDTTDYTSATAAVQINVAQATPTIAWANPADIAQGTALGAVQLDATASVAGSFAYTPGAGTILNAGPNQTLAVVFSPADTVDYKSASATVSINVRSSNRITPTITWAAPADITYGTVLGAVQLDATASVPGTITYSPAAGTVLHAGGGQTLSVTFTPNDTTSYTSATASVQINVAQATPTIAWANPADITQGTALGATQLNAAASVVGSFSYTPSAGTILNAGPNQTLAVVFSPADTVDYKSASATVSINVRSRNRITPTITWAAPTDITYGTVLGAVQLDATASVLGTFTYTPSAGTVLDVGTGQTLSVIFRPNDSIDYTTAAATVPINVGRATPAISWSNPPDITYGTPLGSTQLDASGGVPGNFTYSPAAGTILGVGGNQALSVTFTPNDTAHFATSTDHVFINVHQLPQTPLASVSGVQLRTVRLTKKTTATDIVVTFSGAMNSAAADNLANYQLAQVKNGKKSRVILKPIKLNSALYDPTRQSVTLQLKGKLALQPPKQIRIISSGLLDALGRPLDGNHDGQPGGDYVARLTKGGAQPQLVREVKAFSRGPYQFPVGR
jgi:hypothetical protein